MSAAPELEAAVAALRSGGVVAFPTESSFGLAVAALDEPALARLFALKGREAGKPPPVLIADAAMLARLVGQVPARAQALIDRHWPGPLTLVLPARPGLPQAIAPDGFVGVRRSPHPLADALVRAFGAPLTATSANRAGQPPAMTAAEARAQLPAVDHVLDGVAGGAVASTVARIDATGHLTILRAGAIDPTAL